MPPSTAKLVPVEVASRTDPPVTRRRVAIVYPFFAHYREPLLRELLANGRHDYVLVADRHDPGGGIPALQFKHEPRFVQASLFMFRRRLLWQRGLIRLALRRDIDCIVYLGNAEFLATWISACIARCRRQRVLFWTHGWNRRERGAKALLRKTFYKLAHGLLLYGNYARGIGIEAGFHPERLHVIYNSLDVMTQQRLLARITAEDVERKRRELFGASTAPVVIATGRLTQAKRFDLLISAAAALARAGHRVNLLIVGTGGAEDALREMAAAGELDVLFYGACYDEPMLAQLFAMAAVTVSPGNVGLTCMHSLGYGVPVITHDDPTEQGPEWEAIEPGRTGALFQKNSVDDLARVIRAWTQSPLPSSKVAQDCLAIAQGRYHPRVQRVLIEDAVTRHAAAAPWAARSAGDSRSGIP